MTLAFAISCEPSTAALALRHSVYVKEMRAEKAARDRWDARPTRHIELTNDGIVIGAARLIVGSEMPIGRIGEVSRFCLTPKWRGRRTPVMTLIDGVTTACEESDVTLAIGLMDLRLLGYLRERCGIVFIEIGAPVEFHGSRRRAIILVSDVRAALGAMREAA